MGSEVDNTTVKSSKQPPSTKETPTTPTYPDWSTSMQAYYGGGAAAPFFASPIASSSNPHSYIWGNQPFIHAYATPLSYHAVYPHGGLYSHPNVAVGPTPVTTEADGKGPDEKEHVLMKKSKGNLGDIAGGKSRENVSGFGYDAASQSPSGSEDASNSSEKNINQQEEPKKRRFDQMTGHGANAQNGALAVESSPSATRQSATNLHASMPGKPASNSNIRTDLWNGSSAGAVASKSKPSESNVSPPVAPSITVGHEEERELKRLKRKQSNRESARRSRLRKQEECEKLQTKVEALNCENQTLKKNIMELSEKCVALSSENAALRAELERSFGADPASTGISLQNYTTLTQLINGDDDNKKDRLKESGTVSEDVVNSLNSNGNPETNPY